MPHRMIFPAFVFLLALADSANAEPCSRATIMSPAPFRGNDGEIFKLNDGTVWQVKYDRVYLYEYYPTVVVCPSQNTLRIRKRTLNIELVSSSPSAAQVVTSERPSLIESRIDGRFEGWTGETIFKLENGQIWQQASYASMNSYKYKPKVLIVRTAAGYEMQVEGLSPRVRVQMLR